MNPTAIENHLRFVRMDWEIIIMVASFFGRLGQPWPLLGCRAVARLGGQPNCAGDDRPSFFEMVAAAGTSRAGAPLRQGRRPAARPCPAQ